MRDDFTVEILAASKSKKWLIRHHQHLLGDEDGRSIRSPAYRCSRTAQIRNVLETSAPYVEHADTGWGSPETIPF
jgi:hypothetical protein